MSSKSSIVLEVDEYEQEPNVRRARSNEHFDYLKESERWRRRDEELQITRYRDRAHFGASYQRPKADHLTVPIYETSPRRPRARSDTRDEASRNFKTQEMRPSALPISFSDPELPDPRQERGSTQSRVPAVDRPKIKIPPVVIQEHPPLSAAPGRSPSASPRSPSGQPILQYKYLLLQNEFAEITSACLRYIDVEAAHPRDLTFEKISEQVKGFEFDLKVWSYVANIEKMPRLDVPEDAVAVTDAASRIMDRMYDRAVELKEACARAKPGDLKFAGLKKVDDEAMLFEDTTSAQNDQDPTESLGFIIESSLHGIRLQTKSLKRLTRSLQDATSGAKEEMVAVSTLIGEAVKFFGSDAAIKRYPIDSKFTGRRALDEVKAVTGS
ncbi:hypothetical protein FB567DRAFT_24703 [Paraphoma chrysanthemicola]|uniref:Uncharacterized protein n=1 Tax=Paraphoma chrysanthemicola TaxID=798071 RepID=A0A8K0RK09_9PLEO|nr:hypothetical protein FB567DRAFT_24703 [Paraphoma chrysanthemicola]